MKRGRQLNIDKIMKRKMALCSAIIMLTISIGLSKNTNLVYAETNSSEARFTLSYEEFQKAQLAEELVEVVEGIFEWKKTQEGIGIDKPLMTGEVLEYAGSSAYDWYAFAMGSCDYEDDYESYVLAMKNQIIEKYQTADKLDANMATEWHRQILTLLALGEDPAAITDNTGNVINLVADGTYNRGKTKDLGEQGINGYIWALLALDSMRYQVPEDAADTRESMIMAVLNSQRADGGFAMMEGISDVDITAMALQALAPYYKEDTKFELEEKDGLTNIRTVRESVDLALEYLSSCQENNGTMRSGDVATAESTAQVVTALSCLEIDLQTDERFIKDEQTLMDGMLLFRNSDGGFSHLLTEEDRESNSLVGEQAARALVAYARFVLGESSVYDFRSRMEANGRGQAVMLGQGLLAEYEEWQKEIDEINSQVQTHLYPFEDLKKDDLKRAAAIVKRLDTMPEYARELILEYEKLYEAAESYEQKDTVADRMEIIILVAVIAITIIVIAGAATFIIIRNNKKKASKENDWEDDWNE